MEELDEGDDDDDEDADSEGGEEEDDEKAEDDDKAHEIDEIDMEDDNNDTGKPRQLPPLTSKLSFTLSSASRLSSSKLASISRLPTMLTLTPTPKLSSELPPVDLKQCFLRL